MALLKLLRCLLSFFFFFFPFFFAAVRVTARIALNVIIDESGKSALKKKALGKSKGPVPLRGWPLPFLTGGKKEGGAFCSFGFVLNKPLKVLNAFGIAIGGAAKVPFVVAISISGFGVSKDRYFLKYLELKIYARLDSAR
ncbi:hypothetical protein GGTG_03304 [Gaeumannomyces tritici R3-111a-1]|uniref:Uncharacterized protein n=1 Tax=Gaeumannomyces tritici (strain R3-111a-1) TaxID=644352 RepID=J3NPU7_GAET3|nr:hypothetical protein GGTG_03304 [Gaeumannomyces tritici R3-111a-1]EJT78202.1 hypothetical protein GGTG_03304 [Gaeumannomyces tritici R3-111a-1]